MEVKVILFGSFSELGPGPEFIVEDVPDLKTLLDFFESEYPLMKTYPYSVAVNLEITKGNVELKNRDEIAIMPPFAGG